jgi:hypothetical protein
MEFLMTYGWALLVILLVLAALAYFGMLNPDRFLPDKMSVSDQRIQLTSTQSNGLLIKNAGSDPLYNLQINMTNHNCKISAPNTLSPGETKRFMIVCNEPAITNNRLKGDLKINYSSSTYGQVMQKTVTGTYAVRGNYFSGNGLVGYWPLDDANDYSDQNNPATVTGAASLSSGKLGGAYSFDGTTGYLNIGDKDILNPHLNSMTVSLWVKTSDSDSLGRLYTKGTHGGSQQGYSLQLYPGTGGKVSAIFGVGHEHIIQSDASITNGQWNHIVGVFDRTGNEELYVNGIKQAATASIADHSSLDIGTNLYSACIGASCSTNGAQAMSEYLNGIIDDVMVFNRVLTADEIKALYQSGR